MARGGARPGAGLPRGSGISRIPQSIVREAAAADIAPLDYSWP